MVSNVGVEILSDTKLWRRLCGPWSNEPARSVAGFLAANLQPLCQEAANRMKSFPSLHPQFTLHDDRHLLRVTQLMGELIPETVLLDVLNPVEIALLILSAYFHDQGMVLDAHELQELETNPDFVVFRENWRLDHPNYKELVQQRADSRTTPDEREKCTRQILEVESALLTDCVRRTHGERSESHICERYGRDKRLNVCGTDLANILGKLCRSHVLETTALTQSLTYDEDIATFSVNAVYVALVLRLADILDFDRERTPDELYRTIHFSNPVSLEEWQKHRAITGWRIQPDLIRFTAECERPEYERAIRRFLDWIDCELHAAKSALLLFPTKVARYALPLPDKVDRERIRPRNKSYIYHDLEFSLSRDEIVKLLMGQDLYGSPSLCIRELIQNALDALRHRRAIVKRDEGAEWTMGQVELEHSTDAQGREVLRCIDNGMGMDEEIIMRFLVRAGRSYYRSPEFEQERASLAGSGADFDPCSRFGIGFLSCFMLGDQITVRTRRYGGARRPPGRPLVVEINGLNGLVVFRHGQENQPAGTTVEITGRQKPAFFDAWTDEVRLLETVEAFAIACEFPILASCRIPEIQAELKVPPTIVEPKHALESLGLKKLAKFEQSFSDVDSRLRGWVRTCLLTDGSGNLTLANDEAEWVQPAERGIDNLKLANGQKTHVSGQFRSKTCLDGILVCGNQGRSMEERMMVGTSWANPIVMGDDFFVLDVRGAIKPALTPARGPVERRGGIIEEASWRRLQSLTNRAHGRLWEKVIERYPGKEHAKLIWQIAVLYSVQLAKLRAGKLWDMLWVPTIDVSGNLLWRHFAELEPILLDKSFSDSFSFHGGGMISGDAELSKWQQRNDHILFKSLLEATVFGMGTVSVLNSRLSLEFRPPTDREEVPEERFDTSMFTNPRVSLPFAETLSGVLFAEGPVSLFNASHPLVQLAWRCKVKSGANDLEAFASTFVTSLSRDEVTELIAERSEGDAVNLRALKSLGYMYRALDRSQVPAAMKPPYVIWLSGRGLVEITEEDFQRWRDLAVGTVRRPRRRS